MLVSRVCTSPAHSPKSVSVFYFAGILVCFILIVWLFIYKHINIYIYINIYTHIYGGK